MLAYLSRFIVIFISFCILPAFAENATKAKKYLSQETISQLEPLLEKTQESRLAYEIIESLTTEVGPRLAGSKAEARARTWAKKKMASLGFKNIRIEPFEVDYWERVIETAEVVKPFPQKLQITSLGGSIGTSRSGDSGEVVRFKTLNDLQEAPINGFKNKIIFVDEFMTRTQDGSGYGMAVKKRSQAAIEGGKRRAKAVLIRSVGTNSQRFPHTGIMEYEKGIKKVPIAALSAPDADQLSRALRRGRVTVKLKLKVKSGGKRESGNVIGEIPGESKEIILIGAHLDSWDLGTGAVDDGAGVGIVMATAAIIAKKGIRPKRTIRVVLFGSEEVGLVGAEAYAKKYAKELDLHVLASESDFGAGKVWRFDTGVAEEFLDKSKEIYRHLIQFGVTPGHNRAFGGPDIIPLKKKGVPVVSLTQNGWDYFNFHHTSNDTFDKIKQEDLVQNVSVWTAFTWMAANIEGSFKSTKVDKSKNEQKLK